MQISIGNLRREGAVVLVDATIDEPPLVVEVSVAAGRRGFEIATWGSSKQTLPEGALHAIFARTREFAVKHEAKVDELLGQAQQP